MIILSVPKARTADQNSSMNPSGRSAKVNRSDPKEKTTHLIYRFLVTTCGATVETLEGCQHKIRRVKTEDSLAAFEITGLGLGFEFAVLYSRTPLPTPLT